VSTQSPNTPNNQQLQLSYCFQPIVANPLLNVLAYAPATQEKHFQILEKYKQKIDAYISILYMCTLSFAKNNIFYVLCKKDKKISLWRAFLAPKFVILHITQKLSIFCETTLRAQRTLRCMCDISVRFFNILKYVQNPF
jgi:hypothetical protein